MMAEDELQEAVSAANEHDGNPMTDEEVREHPSGARVIPSICGDPDCKLHGVCRGAAIRWHL